MIKLRHKKGQVSMELVLLILVVVIGAAIVATEMSKVKLNAGPNAVNNVKYAASVAFANGHVSNTGTSGGTTNTTENNNTNTNPTNTNNNKPDLVGALEVNDVVLYNKTYIINVTVSNTENENINKSFVITLKDNGKLIGTKTINRLNDNGHKTVSFNWYPGSIGEHHLVSYVDANDDIDESNESNNIDSKTVNVIGHTQITKPDLTGVLEVGNIIIHNNTCNCHHKNSCGCHHNIIIHNNTYMVNIIVSNIGNENTNKSFVITLKDNGNLIGEDTINGLNASESKIVSFNWTPGSIGEHHLVSYVDANDDIDESNESNNIDSKTVNAIGYNSSISNVNISGEGLNINPNQAGIENNELTITEINGNSYTFNEITQNKALQSGKAISIIYRWKRNTGSIKIDGTPFDLTGHKITMVASKDNPINYTIKLVKPGNGNGNSNGHWYLSFNATHANITIEEGHSKTNIIDTIILTIENIINFISSSI